MSAVSYVSGCFCCCGGGLCVAFLSLSVRVGDGVEAVGCKGRAPPPPDLSSFSSSVCLSSLLSVDMVSMCIRGRCLKTSGRKRSSLHVFALFLAKLRSAVSACYMCCMLLNVV